MQKEDRRAALGPVEPGVEASGRSLEETGVPHGAFEAGTRLQGDAGGGLKTWTPSAWPMVVNATLQCANCNERMTVQYASALRPGPHHAEAHCPVCRDPEVINRFLAHVLATQKRHAVIVRITF